MSEPGRALMEIEISASSKDVFGWNSGMDLTRRRPARRWTPPGPAGTANCRALRPLRKEHWWDVRFSPINGPDGKPEFILSISRDITFAHNKVERANDENVALEQRVRERTTQLTQSSSTLLSCHPIR
jgi:hypothetical protein